MRRIAADKALDYTLFSPNTRGRDLRPRAGGAGRRAGRAAQAVRHRDRAPRARGAPGGQPLLHRARGVALPARQALGAVLLEAGRAREAETVYWDDLRRHADNGWSLFGLAQALRAQGKKAEADAVQARFDKAWGRADVKLSSSRF